MLTNEQAPRAAAALAGNKQPETPDIQQVQRNNGNGLRAVPEKPPKGAPDATFGTITAERVVIPMKRGRIEIGPDIEGSPLITIHFRESIVDIGITDAPDGPEPYIAYLVDGETRLDLGHEDLRFIGEDSAERVRLDANGVRVIRREGNADA